MKLAAIIGKEILKVLFLVLLVPVGYFLLCLVTLIRAVTP